MRYHIVHTTTYNYSQAVTLEPHVVRLRSRSDNFQTLHSYTLDISPTPTGRSLSIDLEGNNLEQIWFSFPLHELTLTATSDLETHCEQPFNYLVDPWATTLPINYPSNFLSQLHPYFYPLGLPTPISPQIAELATEIAYSVNHQTTLFLTELNQRIYQTCQHQIRETGAPLPPSITWKQQLGSCRDVSVLFMEACRSVGLAARFVSGYQEGDIDSTNRDLHAWVEVYIPGAGWRGFDPTHGLAVADRHMALVSSSLPQNTVPISGAIRGSGVQSKMTFHLSIDHTKTLEEIH